jgi:hypothetical protein
MTVYPLFAFGAWMPALILGLMWLVEHIMDRHKKP